MVYWYLLSFNIISNLYLCNIPCFYAGLVSVFMYQRDLHSSAPVEYILECCAADQLPYIHTGARILLLQLLEVDQYTLVSRSTAAFRRVNCISMISYHDIRYIRPLMLDYWRRVMHVTVHNTPCLPTATNYRASNSHKSYILDNFLPLSISPTSSWLKCLDIRQKRSLIGQVFHKSWRRHRKRQDQPSIANFSSNGKGTYEWYDGELRDRI